MDCTQTSNMRISLHRDDSESYLSGILVHVDVSELDNPPKFIYSHSFRYNVPSSNDGKITIYKDRSTTSGDLDGTHYSFALEKCCNTDCKKENPDGCPVIADKPNRLLVADAFHTQPTQDALESFGRALFKAIFSGVAEGLLQETYPTNPIYLQLNNHDDLDAIPWEYAKDYSTSFLVHQHRFARIYDRPQNPLPKHPLQIVAVVPDPVIPPNEPGVHHPDLHLREQFQNFIDGFTRNNKRVKLKQVFPPTLSETCAILDTMPAASTVLHFIGHCERDEENSSRVLIFEQNITGKSEYINALQLVSVFKNLKLAFLSAGNSREVARVMAERGVRYTIGLDCSIPDNLTRKFEFEFYKALANGYTVDMAMYQARTSFQVSDDIRQSHYFAGAMVLYVSVVNEEDGAFLTEEGVPDINVHEPQHNQTALHTTSVFRGHTREPAGRYSHLRNMVPKKQTRHVYTIKGNQEFVAEAMRMTRLFPGGIFTWVFDKEKTSATDYFQRLMRATFSEDICATLEQYGNDVDELGSAIIRQFRTGNHATCLLILDQADTLDSAKKEKNIHAEKLGNWLDNVSSELDNVKILVISKEPLDWLKGRLVDLDNPSNMESGKSGHNYFVPTKKCIYFYGVPTENFDFVERYNILRNMEASLDKCRILALRGPGGTGKTQLMLRYCYLHRAAYDYIFWLETDSWSTAIESFYKLAIHLGIDEENIMGEDAVIDWISIWLQDKTQWLLFLNNCDNEMEKKMFEFLARIGDNGEGKIILTTCSHTPSEAMVIDVDKMEEDEALLLLFGISSMDSIDKESAEFSYARKITAKLDYMPLAIALARAYIKNTSISFEIYLSMIQEVEKRNGYDDQKHTIATVWQLSLERIRLLSPIAVQILKVCAFLQPENIPVHLFKHQYSVLQLASISEQSLGDIEKAVAVLVKFSFMKSSNEVHDDEEDSMSDLLTIHHVLQKVIYDTMDNDQILCWAPRISTALIGEIDFSDPYTLHSRRTMDIYLAHIRNFSTLLTDFSQQSIIKELILLLNETNKNLLTNRMYFSMRESAQLAVRLSDRLERPFTAISLNNLAGFYKSQGKYDEAEPLYQQALEICEKLLGVEHPDTATTLSNLAGLYEIQNRYNEAEPLYQRELEIRKKVLGSEYINTASPQNNLAGLYKSQGKYDEAESLYQQELAICEKLLGLEHPDTATTLSNLAGLYEIQGRYNEAEPLYQRELEIREKVLGSEHLITASSLNNLAGLFKNQGKYDEAEPLYQRALEINEKVLGLEHPSTVMSLNNLSVLYVRQGKYDKAGSLYQRVLEISEKVLVSEHNFTAVLLNKLAILYVSQDKYDKAELLFKEALAICEKMLGSEHPYTAMSQNSLADLYVRQEKYNDAESPYQRALVIKEKVLGVGHPDTVTTLDNLVNLYVRQGEYDKADSLYQRALEVSGKVLGSEHIFTAALLNNLAVLYIIQGKYDEAEPHIKEALAICEKALLLEHPYAMSQNSLAGLYESQGKGLGSEHPDTVTTIDNLARLYESQGKYDEAEPLYQRALAIKKNVLGSEHPDTTMAMNNLAELYVRQQKYDKAEPLYQRVLAIKERFLRSEHSYTATTMNDLAELYENQGKYNEAEQLYQRALVIRRKVLGQNHPDTTRTRTNLINLYTAIDSVAPESSPPSSPPLSPRRLSPPLRRRCKLRRIMSRFIRWLVC